MPGQTHRHMFLPLTLHMQPVPLSPLFGSHLKAYFGEIFPQSLISVMFTVSDCSLIAVNEASEYIMVENTTFHNPVDFDY